MPAPKPPRTRTLDAAALATTALALLGTACGADDGAKAVDAALADASEAVDVAGELTATTACAACAGACSEEAWVYPTAAHDLGPIAYKERPPSAGTHDNCWYSWGVHEKPVPPRHFVHNLEHGGLVLAYDCPDGCAADVAKLEAAGKASGRAFIVTPFAGMAQPFVALAWQHRLLTSCVDEAAIVAFAKAHCPKAPEQFPDPPPAGCM